MGAESERVAGLGKLEDGLLSSRGHAVTAEPYAAATGLIERFAGAFSSGVPVGPRDDGFFGPASVTWRVSTDLSAPVASLRSLLIQALHPLVMAGVDQHSGWRRNPVGRLAATSSYVAVITYGDRDSARRAAQRVRAIYEHVRGIDTVTGLPYAATDPALLLWVHAALVDSALAAMRLFGTALPGPRSDQYVREMTVAAEILGVPHNIVPPDVAALDRYMTAVRPQLRCTPAAAEVMAWLLDPPGTEPAWRKNSPSCGSTSGTPRLPHCRTGCGTHTAVPCPRS